MRLILLALAICSFILNGSAQTGSKPPAGKPAPAKPAATPGNAAQPAKPAGPQKAVTPRDSAVAKLFDKPENVQWIRHFKGRMDDIALVDISLGFDGKQCKGYLNYNKSKARLRLEGTLNGDKLVLEERDAGRESTGKLEGTLSDKRLEAEWTSVDQSIGSRLSAQELLPGQSLNLTCGDNKWANRYITRYNGARADMVLMRTHNGNLNGFLWVESDDKTYTLKGRIGDDNKYELEALTANEKVAAQLQGEFKPGAGTDCNWVGSGEKRVFKFALKDNFVMGCFEYADFFAQYDALFPRTPCQNCNTWLDQQISNWVTRCRSTLAAKKETPGPATRNRNRGGAWSEVATWTDNIFAGYFTFSDTWTDEAQGLAYNFDLRTGKVLTLEELFNKGFNARAWLDDYARKESPKMPQYATDPIYRMWLDKQGFPLFCFRRDGLEISTLFHPTYGRQSLLVPYAMLKPYMKSNNAIAEFVK
ncbi:MAG: hypothetical protein J0L99_10420 [Chitinophagales bacterium]|nr:hypothetical protein [Chitinophagales bacterium]